MKAKKICPACGQNQSNSRSCLKEKVMIDGIGYHRMKYGSSEEGFGPAVGRCMGCGVMPGKNHHWNCGFEMCPACHQQLIQCQCEKSIIE